MKIVVLIENTGKDETKKLKCEHGLSLWIEFEGKNYLLDAGTTDIFLENAKLMQIPIWNTTTCILSHGHYDHSGGFGTYLQENKNAKLYMMKDAMEEYYSGSGGMIHEIGIPNAVKKEYWNRFVFVQDNTQIEENVYMIPHSTPNLEQIGERAKLYRKKEDKYVPDNFSHELSLVFDTKKGLVVFNSCSHGGIKNILQEVQEALPNKKVYAFLGGLHMKGNKNGVEICAFSEEEIEELISYMKEIGMKYLYTGHCTGKIGFRLLKKYGGELIKELSTGKIIEI